MFSIGTMSLTMELGRQGHSQPRRSGGAPAFGGWARGGCEQMPPLPARRSGVGTPGFFLYICNTNSCILMHSSAPNTDTTSAFIKTLAHWRNEDLGGISPSSAGLRPHGPWRTGEIRDPRSYLKP